MKIRYLLVMFLSMFLFPFIVSAKNVVTIDVDKTDLAIGDKVNVCASIPNDDKTYAFMATFSYDQNVFKAISKDDFKIDEAMSVVYNKDNHKFGLVNQSGLIDDDLFCITLVVKKDANVGETNIALTNISASDGNKKRLYPKVEEKVLVTKDSSSNDTLENNKENIITEEKINEIKAFATKPIIITVSIIACLVILLTIYMYYKHRDKNKLIIILLSICVCLVVSIITLCIINNRKQDVNHNGKNDYDDAEEIIKYIIDIKGTEKDSNKDNSFNYDVNNDGKVDVSDVGSSTHHTTENINYKVSLKSIDDDYYVKKGTYTLNLEASIKPNNGVTIKKIEIDGIWYDAYQSDGHYSVDVQTSNVSGIHEFKITKVMLSNTKEINVKLVVKKEILKDIPYIDFVNIDDETNTLSFKLEDNDNAFINGEVIIYDEENNEIKRADVKKNTEVQYDFIKEKRYKIMVLATYDLDSETKNNNYYENESIYTHQFIVSGNYNFKISDVTIKDAIEKGEYPVITFVSENCKNYPVEYVIINSHQYKANSIGNNKYEVVLEKYITDETGRFELNLEQVALNNLKVFENKKDYQVNTLVFNVLKNRPKVEDIELKNNEEDESITVNYHFKDTDDTIIKLTASLIDSTGKTIASEEISKDKINKDITLPYKNNVDGRYVVRFLADYNLGTERHNYQNRNIGDKEILVQSKIAIVSAVVTNNNIFPTKGQPKYTIKYTLELTDEIKSLYGEFAGVTLNGVNYDGAANGIKDTTISFTVPSESGVVDLKVNRVKLRSENYNGYRQAFYSIPVFTSQIDVLKDKPTINDLEITREDYEKREVTFRFNVEDDKGGFETGYVELNGQKENIKKGINEVTFKEVETNTNLTLNFYGTYDLDTNVLDPDKTKNYYKDTLFYSVAYGLYEKEKYENIALDNVEASNRYLQKNEKVKINFKVLGIPEELALKVSKVVIKDQEYSVSNSDGVYELLLNGYTSSGEKNITITDIILENGKKVTLKEKKEVTIEVLKDNIEVDTFLYEVNKDNIKVITNIKDNDGAIVPKKTKIKVFDEDNNLIEKFDYKEEVFITLKENIVRYYIQIITCYDLDINMFEGSPNYVKDVKILDKVISLEKNNIELKDIEDIKLYHKGDTTELVDEVKYSEFISNLDSYFVEISMKNMPTIHSRIISVSKNDDKVILNLEYENTSIEIGSIQNGMLVNERRPELFVDLIKRVTNNLDGNIILTNDYDATGVDIDTIAMIDFDFKGTFDGNGHTIYNLNKPLFNTINGGTVKNLNLENVNLVSGDAKGALANSINGATISDVLVNNFTHNVANGRTGGLIGTATNSTIEKSKASNIYISVGSSQQNGGLVGYTSKVQMKNCYATGTVRGSWNYNGGLVGDANNSDFTNNIAKVNVTGAHSCGIACSYSSASRFYNNVSLSTGAGNAFVDKSAKMEHNYVLGTGEDAIALTYIEENDINKELFKEIGFDETIWRLKNTSYSNIPTLVRENTLNLDSDDYDEEKEILYRNLMILMPFYDSKKIITSAKGIDKSNILNNKEIMHLVPVDENGEIVTYLTSNDATRIAKIKIVFKTGEKKEYLVRYDNLKDMIASYRIPELKIDYTYNHYVIDSNSQLVNNLTNYLLELTYEDNLDKLTPTIADSRIYKDFYNDVTRNELKEFVLKYLANSNYTNTNNDEGINDYLEREIKKDQKLEKLLYVYNYLNRFYSLNFDGMSLNDFILFDFQGFDKNLTAMEIANIFLANEKNFETNRTSSVFATTLGKYTNSNQITDFIEYMVKSFTTLTPDAWVRQEFKGYLVEIGIKNHPEVNYTLWDHLKTPDTNTRVTWYDYTLPILTLPKNAAYIISSPAQFIIGAQRTYIIDPFDEAQQASLRRRIASYTTRMETYYNAAFGIIGNAKVFNDIHTVQIDKRYVYDKNGILTFQNPNSTEEDFHKNFNEVVGQWAYNDHNAATANGAFVIWRVEGLMDGNLIPEEGDVYEYTYHTWSHESAHNVDARLFLCNNERRFDAGGEDYADGNLTQSFGDGDIVMNLTKDFALNSRISTNLQVSRIASKNDIHDFYNKLFQTVYLMDYLEGQAFLQLSSEDQAKIVVQANYPDKDKYEIDSDMPYYRNYLTTVYQEISTDSIKNMNLSKFEDLYDNRLVMFPGVIYSTYGANRYGGENIYKVRWYQPHNDYGRPDSYSIKWLAYEMLGYAGYDNGYIEYYSNIHADKKTFAVLDDAGKYTYNKNGDKITTTVDYKTDLMAINKITNYNTFRDYKLARFNETKTKLEYVKYLDVDSLISEFVNALKADAEKVREIEATALEKYPGEGQDAINKRNSMISSDGKQYLNSKAIRQKIYYTLKNNTNDFRTSIYDTNKTQSIKTILK